jgi:hypothetical protein
MTSLLRAAERSLFSYLRRPAVSWRENGERGLANWCQEEEMRLSLFVMTVALVLATIAGQGALV